MHVNIVVFYYYSVVIAVNLYCNLNDNEDIMVWYVIELSCSLYILNFSNWNALNIRSNLIKAPSDKYFVFTFFETENNIYKQFLFFLFSNKYG